MNEKQPQPNTEPAPRQEKRTPPRWLTWIGRLLATLITLALIFVAVYCVVHRDSISVAYLRRSLSYVLSPGSAAEEISLGETDYLACAAVDKGILVCGSSGFRLYDRNGEQVLSQSATLSQPIITVSGNYTLIYDAGGTEHYLISQQQIIRRYTTDAGYRLLSARVHSSGWLTIVEETAGYRASATVYNASFQAVLTENISSAFVSDGILSPDKKTLALVCIGESDSAFQSSLVFYSLSTGEELSRCSMGTEVLLDLKWDSTGLWAVGQYGVYCVNDGAVSFSCTESAQYLQAFALGGDGFAAVLFSKYQSGGAGTLYVLHSDGTVSTLSLAESALCVSAAGDSIAVLTASALTIYSGDLNLIATTDTTAGVSAALLRKDGSALLLAGDIATRYTPN